ncbi:MAG: response regulator [Candidatus Schekmanbacteria bacterium]|nr:response regulator [Candidatus Schekmanbacteria bacterium]
MKLEQEGYRPVAATSAAEALAQLQQQTFDLVLSDVNMPGMDGITLLREIKQIDPHLLVILLTAISTSDYVIRALKAGAYDYITKPFRFQEVLVSIERALTHTRVVRENERYHKHLEELVDDRTEQIKVLFINTINSLVLALEAKDNYTEGHSRRVTYFAVLIAQQLGLAEEEIRQLELAAMLHDIGKIGISEHVLLKPGPLSREEYQHIAQHPVIGARILAPIDMLYPTLGPIRHHHERFDGRGHPDGLTGENIPLGARILMVADTYDAMTTTRPYRSARTHEEAIEELQHCSGTQFDPRIVEAFLKVWQVEPVPASPRRN